MQVNSIVQIGCWLLLLLTSISFSAYSQEQATNDFNPKQLTIGISTEAYPYHFVDIHGNPSGIMVDLWQHWARLQNVNLSFKAFSYQQSISALKNGDIDFYAGMLDSAVEHHQLLEVDSIFKQSRYIYVHRDLPAVTNIRQLEPFTIGVIRGSRNAEKALTQSLDINLREYDNRQALYNAALSGEVVVFAESEKLDYSFDDIHALKDHFPNYHRYDFYLGEYSAAVTADNTALKRFIDAGLQKISTEQREQFRRKWMSIDVNADALNIVFTSEAPPYMGMSPAGHPQGMLVDIWRLWSEVIGIKVNFIPETMERTLQLVNDQQADINLAYPLNASSDTGLEPAAHIYSTKAKIFVSKRMKNIQSASELSGHKVAIFPEAPYLETFKKTYPQIELVFVNTYDEMIKVAEEGQVSAMVSEVEVMLVKLVRANLQSSFYQLEELVYPIELFSLVNSDNPQLIKIVKEGFKRLPLEQLKQIERNWLYNPDSGYFSGIAQQIDLTDEEISFIQDKEFVTLGITKDWAPFEFVDAQGELSGINKDMAQLLLERLNIPLKVVAYDNFEQLFNALESKEIDFMAGLFATEQRKKKFAFTDPFMDLPWAVLHTRDIKTQHTITNFYGKRIALVKGYHVIANLRDQHPQIDITLVDTVEQGELAVRQGLVDGFIEVLPVASKLALSKEVTPLAVSIVNELPIDSTTFSSHLDNAVLISIIDKILKNTDPKVKEQVYARWFDVKIQTGLDKRFVLRVAALAAIVIVIIIVVIAFWNRKLIQEIQLRKKLEEKMKYMATHDELTGVANRTLLKQQMDKAIAIHQRQQLKLAVLFVDLDGFKNVNDSFGHDNGDNVIVEVAKRLENCVRQSDVVARFGGDEFVILVTGLATKKESTYVAEKIIAEVNRPYLVNDQEVSIGCSIGIAVYPDDATRQGDILKIADSLMYRIKMNEKNSYYIM